MEENFVPVLIETARCLVHLTDCLIQLLALVAAAFEKQYWSLFHFVFTHICMLLFQPTKKQQKNPDGFYQSGFGLEHFRKDLLVFPEILVMTANAFNLHSNDYL